MTREEAITYLKVIWNRYTAEYEIEAETKEAIDMAISALKEEKDGRIRYKLSKPIEYIELDYTDKEVTKLSYDSNITLVTPKGEQQNEYNNITESPNDAIKTDDDVIEHDREWIIGCIKHDGFIKTDRFDKANQIILDALEVQKCHINTEPSDLISRADAVAYPLGFDHYDKENGSREFICGVESYREYIQHLPSVSAKRVGEWIFNGYADENKSWFICSECEHSQFHKSNYCPNCGAYMKGGAE